MSVRVLAIRYPTTRLCISHATRPLMLYILLILLDNKSIKTNAGGTCKKSGTITILFYNSGN